MTISLSDAGKRFNRDWIFRHLTYTFEAGKSYAITGPNGSGKSTLLQSIGGALHLNEGNVQYLSAGQAGSMLNVQCPNDEQFRYVSLCAPYLEVIEEMTVKEFLEFHSQFKSFLPSVSINEIIAIVGLEKAMNKQIRFYSSGMKQRVKLAQCIFSDVPVILLDEPCTNLDAEGVALYQKLINDYCSNRLVLVSSNDEVEFSFCKERLSIMDYK
jgi:ABC-type multidrug transport system ATPase subunit